MSENSELLRSFERMMEEPAWTWLQGIAQQQLDARTGEILAPMAQGQEYEREFLKGERSGIELFMKLAEPVMESLRIDIKQEKSDDDEKAV